MLADVATHWVVAPFGVSSPERAATSRLSLPSWGSQPTLSGAKAVRTGTVTVRARGQEDKKATVLVACRAAQPCRPFLARGATPSNFMSLLSQPTLSAWSAATHGANHGHGLGGGSTLS